MSEDKWHPKVIQGITLHGCDKAVKNSMPTGQKNMIRIPVAGSTVLVNAPVTCSQPCRSQTTLSIDIADNAIHIMDVGCGTGLMGNMLSQRVRDQLDIDNKIKLLKVDKNQPYPDDSLGHYWAYAEL